MDRPNILFITSDQHRWDAVGAYGIVPVRTPNLDALAEDGVLLDRAYCVNPLCSPTRVSMITSLYPSRHGVYTLGVEPEEHYPDTVGEVLSRAGYATGLLGKAHFCPSSDCDNPESPPRSLDMDFVRSWNGPFYGFDHVELCQTHSHLIAIDPEHKHGSLHFGAWLQDKGCDVTKYWCREDQGYCDCGLWDVPEEFHSSTWVAERTIEFIKQSKQQGKPFFAFASFPDPHNPVVVPEPWYSMYDRSEMPDYTYREGENSGKPPFYQEFIETAHYHGGTVPPNRLNGYPCTGRQITRGMPHGVDHPGMDSKQNRQEAVAVYYGMISLMDHHIGRIIDHLKAEGLYEDTLIVFTSDHGEYLGNHGLWWKGLQAYEDCHRIPMIASWPAAMRGGRGSSALQSQVDLAPTFLSAAGLAIPDHYQGVDQLPVWQGDAESAREWAQVEFRPNDSDFYQKTFITDRWKLVTYHRQPYGELYDLANDPEQDRNLWDDPAHSVRKLELLQAALQAEWDKEPKRRPRVAQA